MDKQNDKPDRSKKRKLDRDGDQSDNLEGVIKRQRDRENEGGESTAAPVQSSEEVDVTTQPSSIQDNSTPGCSYNWWQQPAENEATKIQPAFTSMEWRQAKETDMEENAGADSGLSVLNDETEEGSEEEEWEFGTCNLVSRIVKEGEDESWEDEDWEKDFILRMSSVAVRETQEPVYGPQIDPTYDREAAMKEGWDWPDPDEEKTNQNEETVDQDVLPLEEWGGAQQVEGESGMTEADMEGEQIMDPNDDDVNQVKMDA